MKQNQKLLERFRSDFDKISAIISENGGVGDSTEQVKKIREMRIRLQKARKKGKPPKLSVE